MAAVSVALTPIRRHHIYSEPLIMKGDPLPEKGVPDK
jgi:hypothetical protein